MLAKDIVANNNTCLTTDLINDSDYVYSDNYVGIVEDNNDPDKIGRCKIRVYGIFDNIEKSDLPWALPCFKFIGSKVGSFIVPPIGCVVEVRFRNSDIYFPEYTSKVVNVKALPLNRTKNYPNNMIFFETDKGSSFEIDRTDDTTTFYHKSGTRINISTDGTVNISAHKIVDTRALMAKIPNVASGHFNCLQKDPFTGINHVTNIAGA